MSLSFWTEFTSRSRGSRASYPRLTTYRTISFDDGPIFDTNDEISDLLLTKMNIIRILSTAFALITFIASLIENSFVLNINVINILNGNILNGFILYHQYFHFYIFYFFQFFLILTIKYQFQNKIKM